MPEITVGPGEATVNRAGGTRPHGVPVLVCVEEVAHQQINMGNITYFRSWFRHEEKSREERETGRGDGGDGDFRQGGQDTFCEKLTLEQRPGERRGAGYHVVIWRKRISDGRNSKFTGHGQNLRAMSEPQREVTAD